MASQIGSGTDGDDELISGINVTPLVDIVLVLLIIFMLLATRIVRRAIEETFRVDLPRAAHAGEATGATLALVLTKDGGLYIDGVRRTEAELAARTREAVARDKDTRAIISADQGALHGAVVRVIDVVKGEGVARFAINIEKVEPGTR